MDTGLVHRVVCPFTPQLSLVLISRPRRDGTLSWHWCTAAAGGIRTHDIAIASPANVTSACNTDVVTINKTSSKYNFVTSLRFPYYVSNSKSYCIMLCFHTITESIITIYLIYLVTWL